MKTLNLPFRQLFSAVVLVILTYCLTAFKSGSPVCNTEALMEDCASELEDYVFVKNFDVVTDKSGQKIDYSYVLSRGIEYKIVICEKTNSNRRMIVNFYDRNRTLVATNFQKSNKKIFPNITYKCSATGVYYVEAFYEGESGGCGLNIIGFKK
jgi:hypothetical protein